MLLGTWAIDSQLDPHTPTVIRSFVSGLKWLVSIPLIVAIAGGIVCLFALLILELTKTKSPEPLIDIPTPTQPAEHRQAERLRQIVEIENQIQKEELRIKEHERRKAEVAEKLARFHQLKQTRSAKEAAKASLEEF